MGVAGTIAVQAFYCLLGDRPTKYRIRGVYFLTKIFVTLSRVKLFFVKYCSALRFKIIRNFYIVSEVNRSVLILFNMKNY